MNFDSKVLTACMDAFGEPVTYVPGAGAEVAMTGVFDEAYQDLHFDGEVQTVDTKPMLGCRLALFPGGIPPAENEQFVIRGQYWVIKRVHPDGLGHLRIFLHGPA